MLRSKSGPYSHPKDKRQITGHTLSDHNVIKQEFPLAKMKQDILFLKHHKHLLYFFVYP